MALTEAERINRRMLANKVVGIVRRDYLFVDFMKIMLNFAIAFDNEYKENFIIARTLDIVKDVIGSDF